MDAVSAENPKGVLGSGGGAMRLTIEPPVEPPEYTCPRCPVCDAETDKLLRDRWGNIVGCLECVQEVTSWET